MCVKLVSAVTSFAKICTDLNIKLSLNIHIYFILINIHIQRRTQFYSIGLERKQ